MQVQKTSNSFQKGINKDTDRLAIQPDTATHIQNFRFTSIDGSDFIITNIGGTEEKSSLSEGFEPIGLSTYNNIAYIFSYNRITQEGEIGCFPSPVYPNVLPGPNNESNALLLEYTYKPLKNFVVSNNRANFRTNAFEFSPNFPLKLQTRMDYDGSVNIYFTDKKNPMRVINSGFRLVNKAEYILTNRTYTVDNFKDIINLSNTPNSLLWINRLDYGVGKLPYGKYFYHIKYITKDFNQTDIIATSLPFQVYNNRYYNTGGVDSGSDDTKIGTLGTEKQYVSKFSNRIELKNVDTQYYAVRVIVEHKFGVNDEISKFYEIDKNYLINNSSLIVEHKGNENTLLFGEADINFVGNQTKTALDITQLNSRLIACNIENAIDQKSNEYLKNFAEACQLIVFEKSRATEIEQEGTLSTNWGDNTRTKIGYRDPQQLHDSLGYFGEEAYQYAIEFYFKNGQASPAFLPKGYDYYNNRLVPVQNNLGIVRFPKITTKTQMQNIFLVELTGMPDLSVSSPQNDWIKENILGFRLVRKERETNLIGQGILSQGMSFPTVIWGQNGGDAKEMENYFQTKFPNYKTDFYDNTAPSKYLYGGPFQDDPGDDRVVCPLPFGLFLGYDVDPSDNFVPWSLQFAEVWRDISRFGVFGIDFSADIDLLQDKSNTFIYPLSRVAMSFSEPVETPSFSRDGTYKNTMTILFKTKALVSEAFDNKIYKSKIYKVFGNTNAKNEKFTSYLETEESGGFKYGDDRWFEIGQYTGFDDYAGIEIVGITSDNSYQINRGDLKCVLFHPNWDKGLAVAEPKFLWETFRTGNFPGIVSSYPENRYPNFMKKETGENYKLSDYPFLLNHCFDVQPTGNATFDEDFYSATQGFLPLVNIRSEEVVANVADIYNDQGEFFPVSNWYNFDEASDFYYLSIPVRGANGDCYLGNYTHRIFTSYGEKQYGGMAINVYCENKINPYGRVVDYPGKKSLFPIYGKNKNLSGFSFPSYVNSQTISTYNCNKDLGEFLFLNKSPQSFLYEKSLKMSTKKTFSFQNVPFIAGNFRTRVIYSDKQISGAFADNYRNFGAFSFQDYDAELGSAIAIHALRNQLFLIQESGISLLSFDERQAITDDASVIISTNTALSPYSTRITKLLGSQHRDSVIATDNYIYGIDVDRKVIWRIEGTNINQLSLFKISGFLKNILRYYENKITDVNKLQVRTFFDSYFKEVLFCFYTNENGQSSKVFTLCYNELLNIFTSFYTFYPEDCFNLFDSFYSIKQGKIYQNNIYENRCLFYEGEEPDECYISYVVNPNTEIQKIYDALEIVSNSILPSKLGFRIYNDQGILKETILNYNQVGIPQGVADDKVNRIKWLENVARCSIPKVDKPIDPGQRHRDVAIEILIFYKTSERIGIKNVLTNYRMSMS